jgi:hypothetical protein
MRSRPDIKAGLTTLAAVLLLTASPSRADEPLLAPIKVTPKETGVLLLPPLDATPDSAHMLAPRHLVIRHREECEFITRQFKMLGEAMATNAAAASPGIDLTALSERTAGNLDLLAQRTGADWVVSIVVQEAKMDSSEGGFKIHTRVLLQVWDARRHGWLANSPYTSQVNEGGSPVFVFIDSLDDATKGSLAHLLSDYPPVVAVVSENTLTDYLAGQTKPFVGDPQTPTSGLPATP